MFNSKLVGYSSSHIEPPVINWVSGSIPVSSNHFAWHWLYHAPWNSKQYIV